MVVHGACSTIGPVRIRVVGVSTGAAAGLPSSGPAPHPRRSAGTLLVALLLAALVALPTAAWGAPVGTGPAPAASDPASLVNPFIGTGSGGPVVGEVNMFPGVSVPFGMVQWSPDTPRKPVGSGYWYDDHDITGFSLTHLSGAGCYTGGDLPFLPLAGRLPDNPSAASVPFTHDAERASPGVYTVTAGGVRTELTASARTGLARLTYPRTGQAQLLVKVAGSQNGSAGATFTAVGDREITGSVTSGRFCGQPNGYTVHFAARFDRPFVRSGTWSSGGGSSNDSPLAREPSGPASRRAVSAPTPLAGGYVTFDSRDDPVVGVKVALSYVDVAGARANLRAEATTYDLNRQRAAARWAWNQRLNDIRVSGGTPAQRTGFYTALYHALLAPNLFSDADGRYRGFDNKVHRAPDDRPQYANFSGWDVYRSQIPLLALIAPDETADMMTSLLRDADQGGWLPKWPVANGYTGVMNGDAADPMLASAYAFGARRFDARHAVDLMVHGAEAAGPPGQGSYVERPNGAAYRARGYVPNGRPTSISHVPNGASETLEYALADFAVSRLAGAVGRDDVARRFHSRSQNWTNLFDTATGHVRPRDGDGAFPPGPPVPGAGSTFGRSGFQEGNAAQYTWMVPHNLRALADGMGGDVAAGQRLDDYFSRLNVGPNEPFHWQGNETTFGTPFAYNTVGQPWKTQAVVRRILTELYQPTPGGEPGNDDLGALSSWHVWAALGVYPQTPGVPMLVVGSPLFPRAEIDAGPGRRIVVTAPAAAAGRPYVRSLRVNGHATGRTWLNLPARGVTRLDFDLTDRPHSGWGTGPGDAPPSFGDGPAVFPPTTRASLAVEPGQVRLAPGSAATVDVAVDNTLGAQPATVTWQAATGSGPGSGAGAGPRAGAGSGPGSGPGSGARSGPGAGAGLRATPAGAGLRATPAGATVTAPAGGVAHSSLRVDTDAGAATGRHRVTLTAREAGGAVIRTVHVPVTVARPGETVPTAYVSDYMAGTVTPVDAEARVTGPAIPVGSGPDGVVVTRGEAYVAANNANSVTVIATADNRVVATVPVGAVAADVAATPDGTTVWVSNYGDGTVQPIDTATHTTGPPVKVGGHPQRLRVSPDGGRLWVPNQSDGTLSVVDLATRAVVATVPVGGAPFGLAFSPDGRRVYAGGSESLSIVDGLTVTGNVPLGSAPAGLAMAPDGHVLYVTVAADGVLPVDPATGSVGALIPTGPGAYDVEFTADGATAWVVDTEADDVRPVDVATGVAGAPVPVGAVPNGVGLT